MIPYCCLITARQKSKNWQGAVWDITDVPLTHHSTFPHWLYTQRWLRGHCETPQSSHSLNLLFDLQGWVGSAAASAAKGFPTFSNKKENEIAAQQVARLCDLDLMTTHRCTWAVDKGGEEWLGWITGLSLSLISPESENWREDSRRRFLPKPRGGACSLWATYFLKRTPHPAWF